MAKNVKREYYTVMLPFRQVKGTFITKDERLFAGITKI